MPDIRPEPGARPIPNHKPDQRDPKGPPPHHGDIPPHIFRELLELREKIGRLEGMMEVLLKTKS